jgi:hypothetical protein
MSAATYVVLESLKVDSQRDEYLVVDRVEAHSARSAIAKHLSANGGVAGTFVAVPERSWHPLKVKAEQKTQLRFE